MKKILITSDSTCDLSKEQLAQHGIRLIPIYINLGDKTGRDGIDFTAEELYSFVKETGKLPSTAALSPETYKEELSALKEKAGADALIHLSLSSGISSSYQNAAIAAAELEDVYVVDTANLSTGSGHLVLLAAEMAENGTEPEEIVKKLNETAEKIDTSFILDTLEYMKKGGRCSAVTAFGANLLKIKPCIEVKAGKMGVGKKYRGNLSDTLLAYAKDRLADLDSIRPERIFVTHAGTDEANVKIVRDYVESLGYFKEICVTRAGCTISTHCGPNTLGVLYIHK